MIRGLLVLVVGLALALGWAMWSKERATSRADMAEVQLQDAQAEVKALESTLAKERAGAKKMDEIGTEHENDRTEAETVPAAVVADLRNGTLQLRKQWAACETSRLSDATAAALERDALAELRRKDQGDLVRIGRDANDQVRACHAVVIADREQRKGQ